MSNLAGHCGVYQNNTIPYGVYSMAVKSDTPTKPVKGGIERSVNDNCRLWCCPLGCLSPSSPRSFAARFRGFAAFVV